MSLHYAQHEWEKAHNELRHSAACYGQFVAGMGGYPDAARNVAKMRRDAIHAIDLNDTDYEAWKRLRRESAAILALWNRVASPL